MKITKLILRGYTRLDLRNIYELVYVPQEKTQVILGSNGSGKSSLMKELSPLPAALKKEFLKGGGKEIWIEHRGKQYYLTSKSEEGGDIYEFICDGVELNPGRTVTVYRELVKEHFNYTQDIHNLATGRVLFHELSSEERRKLFMAMNQTDFSYAVTFFNRLKERARDLQGTVEQLKRRLATEIEGLLTPEEEKRVESECERLRDILESLLMAKQVGIRPGRELEEQRDTIYHEYKAVHAEILEKVRIYKNTATVSLPAEELEKKLSLRTTLLLETKNTLKIQSERYLEYEAKIKEAAMLGSVDLETLTKELDTLLAEREALVKTIGLNLPWDFLKSEPEALLSQFDASSAIIQDLMDQLEAIPEKECLVNFSREDYQRLCAEIAECKDRLGKGSEIQKRLDAQIEASSNQPEVNCPSCNHRWRLNFNEAQYKLLKEQAQKTEERLTELQKALEAKEELKTRYVLYTTARQLLNQYFERFPLLNDFWSYLVKESITSLHPSRFSWEASRLHAYLTTLTKLYKSSQVIDEKTRLKNLLLAVSQEDREKVQREFKILETVIEELTKRQRDLSDEVDALKAELELSRQIDMLYREASSLLSELKTVNDKTVEAYLDGVMSDLINGLKMDILQKERMVSQVNIKRAVIQDTEKALAGYREDLKLVQAAIEALSPKSGLIAQGMMSFINVFIEEVNRFIGKVWSYPLTLNVIKPDDDDEIDLDYKFTVTANGGKPSPDIASTSSGMREIIHLSCVITAMRFLGLDHHPVFLDEFAVKMDDAHRKAAYSIIENIIDDTDVSQVFLISHYENGYSSLSASDISVLCDANVVLPPHLEYNRCLTIDK